MTIKFASPEDQQAYEFDLGAFGMAMVDEQGRHVPLNTVLAPDTTIDVTPPRSGRSPVEQCLPNLRELKRD